MSRESRYVDLGPQIPDEPRRMRPAILVGGEDSRAALVGQVRQIYMSLYRRFKNAPTYGDEPIARFDGGTDRFGTNCTAVWPRIARHIADMGADPVLYMQAQFYGRATDIVPLPNTLCNVRATERYEAYARNSRERVCNRLKHDLDSIQAYMLTLATVGDVSAVEAMRIALFNVARVTATPLSRYCVAMREGIEDVADYYFRRALLQDVFQKDVYDSIMAGMLPESLRDEATMLRAQLFGRTHSH